jgi:hypothetical protein
MIQSLDPKQPRETARPIGQAAFPAPFPAELEFNAPVHGTWNIVHIGMLMPEAQQIYVCAQNCMRGVVLTAAEMNASHRFSFVILEEQDMMDNSVEDITIEGVADVIAKLPKRPPAVLLFTVCVHHFLGCDLDRIYEELGARFPDITFVRCYMDPIMQKVGLSPDQKLRKAMLEPLQPLQAQKNVVSLLGSNFPLEEGCDLKRLLSRNGFALRQLPECRSYGEYLRLAEGGTFLCVAPNGKYGVEQAARRLGRPCLYLPASFDYEEISGQLTRLCAQMGIPTPDPAEEIARVEEALAETLRVVGDTPIVVDYTVHPRPLGLARLLLQHGFRVEAVYLDGINPEERPAFDWLQQHAPELPLKATIQVQRRILPRGRQDRVLAMGQKAAWFENTPHFVNLVEGGGLWGFQGICTMAALLREAFLEEKDTEDLVPRKGLGCESCL